MSADDEIACRRALRGLPARTRVRARRVEAFLVGSDPPVWESGPAPRGAARSRPHRPPKLQRIRPDASADARERGRRGGRFAQSRGVLAARRGARRPSRRDAFLIALSVAKLQAGVLRKTDAPVSPGTAPRRQEWWRRYVTVVHRRAGDSNADGRADSRQDLSDRPSLGQRLLGPSLAASYPSWPERIRADSLPSGGENLGEIVGSNQFHRSASLTKLEESAIGSFEQRSSSKEPKDFGREAARRLSANGRHSRRVLDPLPAAARGGS